jgi:hypothetical protein
MRYPIVSLVLAFAAGGTTYAAEKLAVTIIGRQDSESSYSYVIPGRSTTTSQANADCSKVANQVNCSGAVTSTTLATPAVAGGFTATGATLSLLLPDGRIVVVNCSDKANHTEWTGRGIRNCRVPTTDKIQAEFDGEKAKLIWPVGIDGKKTQSETYKIITIIEKT